METSRSVLRNSKIFIKILFMLESIWNSLRTGLQLPRVADPCKDGEVAFPVEQKLQLLAVSNPIWRS
jgi:hypothetical protein